MLLRFSRAAPALTVYDRVTLGTSILMILNPDASAREYPACCFGGLPHAGLALTIYYGATLETTISILKLNASGREVPRRAAAAVVFMRAAL